MICPNQPISVELVWFGFDTLKLTNPNQLKPIHFDWFKFFSPLNLPNPTQLHP